MEGGKRRRCNMELEESKISPMDQFPIELLVMIFDRLDILSLKNASRTCCRWQEIIFSSSYINRVVLTNTIVLNRSSYKIWPAMARHIERSQLRYTNMKLMFLDDGRRARDGFNMLYRSIRCHLLDNLIELTLIAKSADDNIFSIIVKVIPEMSRLAVLRLQCEVDMLADMRLHLKSDTLRHLELNSFLLIFLDLPALKSMDMIEVGIKEDIEGDIGEDTDFVLFENLHFLDNLERLKFTQSEDDDGISFLELLHSMPESCSPMYRQLSRLRTLHLYEIEMSETELKTISKSCTGLTELLIECDQMENPRAVHHLSKLPYLRRLTVRNRSQFFEDRISFASTSPLPNLEHFEVDFDALTWDSCHALGAVKSLTLRIAHPHVCSETLSTIARHLPNLTVLQLNLGRLFDTELVSLLHSLHHLTTVERMVLQSIEFSGMFLRDDQYQLDTPPSTQHSDSD